jgi:hypothetical protein
VLAVHQDARRKGAQGLAVDFRELLDEARVRAFRLLAGLEEFHLRLGRLDATADRILHLGAALQLAFQLDEVDGVTRQLEVERLVTGAETLAQHLEPQSYSPHR